MPQSLEAAVDVEIRDATAQTYLGTHVRAPMGAVGPAVQAGLGALYHRLQEAKCTPSGPPFLIADHPKDGFLEMELGAPCESPPAGDGFHEGALQAGRVAVIVHRGSYESIGPLYARLSEWIAAHGLVMAGPPREVYLTPPGEEPVTELVCPVR